MNTRDANDAWVDGPAGRFWGRGGAAGLLAYDPARGVLLQHRAEWSHQGGTWGLPGGARHIGEDAISAALREANEEAGVPASAVSVRFSTVFDAGYWTYTTVGAEVVAPFEAEITDAESAELRWVAPDNVEQLPLHSGFALAWPSLKARIGSSAVLVVDAANVIGSRPDGWWRDRAGAASRLLARLAHLTDDGVPGDWFGLADQWHLWPEIVVVIEGQAKSAQLPTAKRLRVIKAPRDGDGAIVDEVAKLRATVEQAARDVVVVTSDRGLRERVHPLGARTLGPAALLAAIADEPSDAQAPGR